MILSTLFEKVANFFSGKNVSKGPTEIEKLTNAVIALQAQFKYLQQRIDRMEVPR